MYGEDVVKNAVHGSSSLEHARKSITAVFGEDVLAQLKNSNLATDSTSSEQIDS